MPILVQHSRTSSTSSNFASPQPPAPPAYHDLQRQFNGCQINNSLFIPEEHQGNNVEEKAVDEEGNEERAMGTEGWLNKNFHVDLFVRKKNFQTLSCFYTIVQPFYGWILRDEPRTPKLARTIKIGKRDVDG